jgi:hypothetical protein
MAGCGGGSDAASTHSDVSSQGPTEERPGGERSIEEFGEEAAGTERTAIEGAFTGYLSAVGEGDFRAACSHLAVSVRRSVERLVVKRLRGEDCASILPKLLSGAAAAIARDQAEGKIAKVRVEGDRGFVVFRAPGAELYQMTMVREGGKWKTATLAGSVLVPEL